MASVRANQDRPPATTRKSALRERSQRHAAGVLDTTTGDLLDVRLPAGYDTRGADLAPCSSGSNVTTPRGTSSPVSISSFRSGDA